MTTEPIAVKEICDGVWLAASERRSWPFTCNTYILEDRDGLVLIDVGTGLEEDWLALLQGIKQVNLSHLPVKEVLITHGHVDHFAGVPLILRDIPGVSIRVPARSLPAVTSEEWQSNSLLPRDLLQLVPELDGFSAGRFMRESALTRWLEEEECQAIGETTPRLTYRDFILLALPTPGHEAGHLSYYEPRRKLLFCGDCLWVPRTVLPWYTPTSGGIGNYLASLNNLQELDIAMVCPGHGEPSREPTMLIAKTRSQINHSEQALLQALTAGPKSLRSLNNIFFPEEMWHKYPWAISITKAHLDKLEAEGRVSLLPPDLYSSIP